MQNNDLQLHNFAQAVYSCHISPGFLTVYARNTRDIMKVIVLNNAIIPFEVGDTL